MLPARQRKRTVEHKLKILKQENTIGIEKLVDRNNFVFADPHKKEAHAHCTHLQIRTSQSTEPKFAKECNLSASLLRYSTMDFII